MNSRLSIHQSKAVNHCRLTCLQMEGSTQLSAAAGPALFARLQVC